MREELGNEIHFGGGEKTGRDRLAEKEREKKEQEECVFVRERDV